MSLRFRFQWHPLKTLRHAPIRIGKRLCLVFNHWFWSPQPWLEMLWGSVWNILLRAGRGPASQMSTSKCWTVVSGLPAFSAGTFTTIPSTDVTVKPCNNWNVSVYVMRQWFAEMADFFTKCCRFSFPLLPDHFAVSKSDSLWSPVSWFGQCWQGNQNIYFLFHCMSRERMTWFTDQTLYYSDHC